MLWIWRLASHGQKRIPFSIRPKKSRLSSGQFQFVWTCCTRELFSCLPGLCAAPASSAHSGEPKRSRRNSVAADSGVNTATTAGDSLGAARRLLPP